MSDLGMASTKLRALILEDSPDDAELLVHELNRAGFETAWKRIQTEEKFKEELHSDWDVILADYRLPGFDAMGALRCLAESGREIPLLVVTTSPSEEAAVECMKCGATDYLLKDRLARLGPAVRKAMEKRRLWQEQRRIEERNRMLTTAVDQAAEAIFITDPNGVIQYVNPAFTRNTGYSREEAVGNTPRLLRSGRHDRAFYQQLWQTIARGEIWRGQFINRRKDGTQFVEQATISPMRDAAGGIVSYVAVKHDVTGQLQLEEQLRQVQKMESLGQLAGGIAHDFNNLLLVIRGFTDLAMEGLNPEDPIYDSLEKVIQAANRASLLISQLMTFSRREVTDLQAVNLNQLLEGLVPLLGRVIGEHIELRVMAGADLPPIRANRNQIETALVNLCVNARDAMPQGGTITIQTSPRLLAPQDCANYPWAHPGEHVCLSVADTGMGIPPEVQNRVFEPFFTTKKVGKGTGLGLATVYAMVKQHSGVIHFRSQPNLGTTFHLILPVAREAPTAPIEACRINLAKVTQSKTILVAEDDELVRKLAVEILQHVGYRVLTAHDGEEALHLFEKHPEAIDLAILDVVMPKRSGQAVGEAMRARRPQLPILFSSGYGWEELREHFPAHEPVELIQKPFRCDHLLGKINQLLQTAY